jgi:hypothetical protein
MASIKILNSFRVRDLSKPDILFGVGSNRHRFYSSQGNGVFVVNSSANAERELATQGGVTHNISSGIAGGWWDMTDNTWWESEDEPGGRNEMLWDGSQWENGAEAQSGYLKPITSGDNFGWEVGFRPTYMRVSFTIDGDPVVSEFILIVNDGSSNIIQKIEDLPSEEITGIFNNWGDDDILHAEFRFPNDDLYCQISKIEFKLTLKSYFESQADIVSNISDPQILGSN